MKKLLLLILVNTSLVYAVIGQVVFDQVGFGLSYWGRTYEAQDERVLLTNPPTAKGELNPVLIPHLYGRVKLGQYLGIKGTVGMAQDNYQSSLVIGNLVRNESIEQTILPLGAMLDFSIPIGKKGGSKKSAKNETEEGEEAETEVAPESSSSEPKFKVMGGIGVNRYFIQHSFTRQVTGGEGSLPTAKFSGNDFGITGMIGLAHSVSDRIVLTLFTQYNSGSYNHRVYSEEVPGSFEVKNIPLKGLEAGISVGYILKK
ncbi:MAG: hypothetical protein KGZ81_06410 [Flavobacteriales bacterium]|nr:hypothetical protein [Flavobacteriales bacterium]